jgi:hypothetical protein
LLSSLSLWNENLPNMANLLPWSREVLSVFQRERERERVPQGESIEGAEM